MNNRVEAGRDQLIECADVAEIAGNELDALRRAAESLGIKVVDRDFVLFPQELVDDVGTEKSGAPEN
jgi:hypothetical protein